MPSDGTLVLVVDDDIDILDTVELVLRLEGCRVQRASTGGEACRTLDRIARGELERPRLMLLDLMLPDMEGEDVFAHLRGLPALSLPVTIMSAAVDAAARAEAMGARHLSKPFNLSEIVALLDQDRAL